MADNVSRDILENQALEADPQYKQMQMAAFLHDQQLKTQENIRAQQSHALEMQIKQQSAKRDQAEWDAAHAPLTIPPLATGGWAQPPQGGPPAGRGAAYGPNMSAYEAMKAANPGVYNQSTAQWINSQGQAPPGSIQGPNVRVVSPAQAPSPQPVTLSSLQEKFRADPSIPPGQKTSAGFQNWVKEHKTEIDTQNRMAEDANKQALKDASVGRDILLKKEAENTAKQEAEAPKRAKAAEDMTAAAANTLRKVNDIIGYTDEKGKAVPANEKLALTNWNTGVAGGSPLAQNVVQTSANLAAALHSIGADVSLDTLQEMRAHSPTGAALGRVTNIEILMLKDKLASIGQIQDKELLRDNLEYIRKSMKDIHDALAEDAKNKVKYDKESPTSAPALPDGWSVKIGQ